jgi:hypothetical protein
MKMHRLLSPAFVVLAGLAMYPSAALAQGEALFAVLVGGTEVNASGQANQGDLNGFGTATVIVHRTSGPATDMVCFGITVRGIDKPNAAHIHRGRAGVSGGIVVPLTAPATGNPGASSGCVNGVAVATVNAMLADPTEFYVNVHTGLFPSGALRGNLF